MTPACSSYRCCGFCSMVHSKRLSKIQTQMHSLNIHVVVYTLEFNLIHLASGKWSAMLREVVCIPTFNNKASPDYPTTFDLKDCLSPSWVKFWHTSSSLSEQKTVLKRNNYAIFPITSNKNKKSTYKKKKNTKNKTKQKLSPNARCQRI